MAKSVAPGHLKIDDENLDIHPKSASSIAGEKRKSKAFDDNTKRKSSRKALDDNTEKKSPQTKASSKEGFLKFININEDISWDTHCNCFEEEEAEKMKMMRRALKDQFPESDEDEYIEIQEQKRVSGSLKMTFHELPPLPDACSGLENLSWGWDVSPRTPTYSP